MNNTKNLIISLISALIIFIFYKLNIDMYWYLIVHFVLILLTNLYVHKNNKQVNKKAYYLLIPIVLILISNIVISNCGTNLFLNIVILPILISIFFFSLLNKEYVLSFENVFKVFKIFPGKLISNLKYIKFNITKEKNKRILNILFGIIIGFSLSVIIIFLLSQADSYFENFISRFDFLFDFNISGLIIFVLAFVIIFSIVINVSNCSSFSFKKSGYKKIDELIIIIILSMINFIFLLFLVSEISKLSNNFLQIPRRYTYASYAREGFFELLFVTLINFAITLYISNKTNLLKKSKSVNYLTIILVIFSILLMFNSYYRMYLYMNQFGFTILRLQVILFLLMELILFIFIIINNIKKIYTNNPKLIFIVMITFYIINLYICNNTVINFINKLLNY